MSTRTGASIDWFRKPGTRDEADRGTLNACYNALDRHVIRGRADDVAVVLDDRGWTYAELLAEVGAFAGVLRAFGVGVDDRVLLGPVPGSHGVIAALATARLGATTVHGDAAADGVRVAVLPGAPVADPGDTPVITLDDSGELSWEVVMRAGRTDPAGCADVAPDNVLADLGDRSVSVLDALEGAAAGPDGSTPVDIGGLTQWVRA
ncbi:AMP-binding protein [Nocardioides currus]|uniref:AMP-binding protein n=1 Tax=Nocardioides currus TaxID=2133958 RepID=UPI001402A8A3|nr:AMP-binding protein [Nocardioides currus]